MRRRWIVALAATVLAIIGVCVVFWACLSYTFTWSREAQFSEYSQEFELIQDYILQQYAGEENKIVDVKRLDDGSYAFYDNEQGVYPEVPENVLAALKAVSENAFPSKDMHLDYIRIRGSVVSFEKELGNYMLVYSPDGKPGDGDDDVKRAGGDWYHWIVNE